MSIQYEHKIRRMSKSALYNQPGRSPMADHEYNLGGEPGWHVVHVTEWPMDSNPRSGDVIFLMEREISPTQGDDDATVPVTLSTLQALLDNIIAGDRMSDIVEQLTKIVDSAESVT